MPANRILVVAALACVPAFAQPEPGAPAPEAPLVLDTVQTSAAREREIVVRTVLAGLKRNKSDRPEDSELIVCEKGKRTGTSITTIRCGKNRTWQTLGAETKRDGAALFGMVPTGLPKNVTPANRLLPLMVRASTGTTYNARLDSELMEFDLSLLKNQEEFTGTVEEHDARVYDLLEVERKREEAEREALVRFILAFNAVRRADAAAAPGCEADPACSKAHAVTLERAIIDAGMTVKDYNSAVLKLEIDPQFRGKVSTILAKTAQ